VLGRKSHAEAEKNVCPTRARWVKTLIPAFSHERLGGTARLGFGRSREKEGGALVLE